MSIKKENKIVGIILIICAILIFIPIPLMQTKYISSLGIIGCAIYLLLSD